MSNEDDFPEDIKYDPYLSDEFDPETGKFTKQNFRGGAGWIGSGKERKGKRKKEEEQTMPLHRIMEFMKRFEYDELSDSYQEIEKKIAAKKRYVDFLNMALPDPSNYMMTRFDQDTRIYNDKVDTGTRKIGVVHKPTNIDSHKDAVPNMEFDIHEAIDGARDVVYKSVDQNLKDWRDDDVTDWFREKHGITWRAADKSAGRPNG